MSGQYDRLSAQNASDFLCCFLHKTAVVIAPKLVFVKVVYRVVFRLRSFNFGICIAFLSWLWYTFIRRYIKVRFGRIVGGFSIRLLIIF